MKIDDPMKIWNLPPMTYEQFDARSLTTADCLFEMIALAASDEQSDPHLRLALIKAACRVWQNRAHPPVILTKGETK